MKKNADSHVRQGPVQHLARCRRFGRGLQETIATTAAATPTPCGCTSCSTDCKPAGVANLHPARTVHNADVVLDKCHFAEFVARGWERNFRGHANSVAAGH